MESPSLSLSNQIIPCKNMCARAHTHTHACIHIHMCTHMHAYTYINTHMPCTQIHIHTHMHTCVDICTHMYEHIHHPIELGLNPAPYIS